MKINISKKQYECLMMTMEASASVYGILGDSHPEQYKKRSDELEYLQAYLLSVASEFDAEHMTQQFDGEVMISDIMSDVLQEVIRDYNDETFWHELETRLGKRDFERTETAVEKKEMDENGGWYPKRIDMLYKGWIKEFEKHGIERLGIIKNKEFAKK